MSKSVFELCFPLVASVASMFPSTKQGFKVFVPLSTTVLANSLSVPFGGQKPSVQNSHTTAFYFVLLCLFHFISIDYHLKASESVACLLFVNVPQNRTSFSLSHKQGHNENQSSFAFSFLFSSKSESIVSSLHSHKSCYCLYQFTLSRAIRTTVAIDPRDLLILKF